MKRMQGSFLFYSLVFILMLLFFTLPAMAETDNKIPVPGVNYELPDESEYKIANGESVKEFFYGAKSMGTLCIVGNVDKQTEYDGLLAFGTNEPLSIHYSYDGSYLCTDVFKWYVDGDAMGKVESYDFGGLFRGVGHGCIIVEKSTDGDNWDRIQEPKLNYFTEIKDLQKSLIYNIPEEEIKNGCYYRIVVAYRFTRKTGNGFLFIGDSYESRKCIEEYKFYVSSEKNYVSLLDMSNGAALENKAETSTGFQISKNGSKAIVTVRDKKESCRDFECFTEPGEYNVDITTTLGSIYSSTVVVTDGVDLTEMKKTIYCNEKDQGFPARNTSTNTVFGSPLTSLSLVVPKGTEIVESDDKYGIKGKSVSLFMKLNRDIDNLGDGWVVSYDKWGHNTKEQVCGIYGVGDVGTGALIIQTSKDGNNWTTEDRGRLADGLHTTDYGANYGKAQNVLIYTPSGIDVLNGTYIRVLFAYQVYQEETKKYYDYVEKYYFYLCSNELGAVAFHNLSVEGELSESFADEDQNTVEVYKKTESLVDNSYTTAGFVLDKSLNPTVKYTVYRNGMELEESRNRFEDTGKYDIRLESMVGSRKQVTIYVDRQTPEEAVKCYFGDGFITGKRIFSEGEYPVYEGGEFTYHVESLDNIVLPLYGRIINQTTGAETIIEQNHEEKTGVITEPGFYQAVFSTSEKMFTGELSGDARVFTFHFTVIEQGTAPGPVINQKLLDEYSRSSVVDCNPVYYGLTYSSAEKGYITLAFATREEAVDYAYKYESGMVEKQDNGVYRYTGSFIVDQKTKFNSAWDLTDAVNYFADAAVHKHYFDLSDEFTYLSLKTEILESNLNLRQLELPRSVTIFADGQKEKLTDIDVLPLLNDKPYAYLNPETGEIERGLYSFEFVTDHYGGIDSKTVMITDADNHQHAIRYSESVGRQLHADHCPSGIVTVREETMYGDFVEYKAVYIAPEDNQTELALQYTDGGNSKTIVCRKDNVDSAIAVEEFSIVGLRDPLDAYAYVVVKHNQSEEVFTAKDSIDKIWSAPGEYCITCMNRLGYGYTIPVTVIETEKNKAEVQTTPVTTEQPTFTPEPVVTKEPEAEKPDSADDVTEQPQKDPIADQKDVMESSAAPADLKDDGKGNKSENGNSVVIIIILVTLAMIAAVGVFVYRRGKMYTRMTDAMKSEEDDKHE